MAIIRKDQFGGGSVIHVVHRGARGSNIVRDNKDKDRFLQSIYWLNDKNTPRFWRRMLKTEAVQFRTAQWEREVYVDVLAYCLMPNHFHLMLHVRNPEDVGKFMQRLCIAMAMHFNTKYGEKGALFQGKYVVRHVEDDEQIRNTLLYIVYKNPCELMEEGLTYASENPLAATTFVKQYKYGSFADMLGYNRQESAILDLDILRQLYPLASDSKQFEIHCKEYLKFRQENIVDDLM